MLILVGSKVAYSKLQLDQPRDRQQLEMQDEGVVLGQQTPFHCNCFWTSKLNRHEETSQCLYF